ncbi:hypothetical protein ACPFUC_002396, partial [Vibrio cholerae]
MNIQPLSYFPLLSLGGISQLSNAARISLTKVVVCSACSNRQIPVDPEFQDCLFFQPDTYRHDFYSHAL